MIVDDIDFFILFFHCYWEIFTSILILAISANVVLCRGACQGDGFPLLEKSCN